MRFVAVLFSKDDPKRAGFPPEFPSECAEFETEEEAIEKYPTRTIMSVDSYNEFKKLFDEKYGEEVDAIVNPRPGFMARVFLGAKPRKAIG